MSSVTLSNPINTGLTTFFLTTGIALIPALIMQFSLLDEISDRWAFTRQQEEEFDFIIVGLGSTGSVIARRLSENFRVLALEAGGEPFPMQSIPIMSPLMLGNPSLDWNFYTKPQKHACFSLNNQSSYLPRGKGLGGTSNLNFMVWIRGHPYDFDGWHEATGDERWSYDELLPYFKKSETYTAEGDPMFHGKDGEVTISSASFAPIAKHFVKAAEEMGYHKVDLNAPYQEGFNEHVYNQKRGHRAGAFNAFVQPIRQSRRDRLVIRKYSFVTKVLFKGSNNLAYGVEYEKGGVLYQAKCRKEVILSAGAIGSPKILMLSGIGPSQHLESLGIKTRVNAEGVGKNLQDHVIALVPFTIDNPDGGRLTYIASRDSSPSDLLQYLGSGTGPLSQAGVTASGFVSSNRTKLVAKINNEIMWPDIQLILNEIPTSDANSITVLAKAYNLKREIAEDFYGPLIGKEMFHIMSIASRPKSRGEILLRSSDPKAYPLIDPNYYENPDDVDVTLEGIRKAISLVETTTTFKEMGASLYKKPFPTCADHDFNSDEYWQCYIRHYSLSVYHQAGTCKMGKENDPEAVVDSSLRVLGTERLRVNDASIMPQIISSNIQAASTVIGERGAQMIKEFWGIAP